MKIYILITGDESSNEISGVYSSREKLINALTSTFSAETLYRVETWDVDCGFVDFLNIKKQTTISIED